MECFFDKYIFVAPGSDYGRAMWADLADCKKCIFLEHQIDSHNIVLSLIHHIHFSFGINNYLKIPFQSIWKNYYLLNDIHFEDKYKYCIILPDVSACRIDTDYLSFLANKSNVELILINVNLRSKKEKLIADREQYFSKIFSFDEYDCKKYGYIFYPAIYSCSMKSKDAIIGSAVINSDAFFVGSYTPERYRKLISLYNMITDSGGKAEFYINNVPRREKRIRGIIYNKPISYKEVIQKIYRTNCIVEIMNVGQVGFTLRVMEAISNNKKLLTDNQSVQKLIYYKQGFIQYQRFIDDVNIEFILQRESVDYKYEGDFSPNRLVNYIDKLYCGNIK